MKKASVFSILFLLLMFSSCHRPAPAETTAFCESTAAIEPETEIATVTASTEPIDIPTVSTGCPSEPETTSPPVPVVELTDEEKNMLLKLGMAERGNSGCTECIALVMRTVLNRVESDRFGSSIPSVIFAQDQFTPISDGSYDSAQPNAACQEALEMVIYGWDESQGALFYEWCQGESWHSQNLHLLLQHCDTRFYD